MNPIPMTVTIVSIFVSPLGFVSLFDVTHYTDPGWICQWIFRLIL